MWPQIILWVVTTVISYALQPKPQNAKPAQLKDIQQPTAEEGREFGVLFGTRDIQAPNSVWYGHLRTIAIKSKGGKK